MDYKEASEIELLFDRIAPVYDRLNNSLSFGLHRIWKEMAVKWVNPQLGDRGLDICCGSGDIAQILAQKVGVIGKVIGIDFSTVQLEIARQKSQDLYPQLSLEWVKGDALDLPFANEYFDCITMGYGLRNVVNIPLCLQEVYRVLKPKAKASILDFHRPETAYLLKFQQWYLQNIVVPTAKTFGLTDEYAYITPSLEKFPTGKEQIELAKNAGFSQAIHYSIAGGMMGVLVLQK
jgi:demethylmenaquinone methyltransferase/2-methoxy-6-polyprenyl-1,4-benzoquinol methylase